jgi:putative membrane protein
VLLSLRKKNAMTGQSAPQPTTTAMPPREPPVPSAPPPERSRMHTRISGARTAMIGGAVGLVVVMIFIIQNAHAVSISFFGAHLHVSLAVALLLAAIAGALLMAAAGTARITQLRQAMRRDRRKLRAS